MSKGHKKIYRVLNYIEHSLILISTVTGCVSISAVAITAGIKKYKSIIQKKKKKLGKIVLLAKSKFKSIKFYFLRL